jgi:outer membrane scaffolding protein for murein synthesis (MipA/OmpV family)
MLTRCRPFALIIVRCRTPLVVACACLMATPTALGADKPLWELGAGFTVLDFPDYRGSDERTTYAWPIPYAIYRGKILKADRDRIRGLFFEADRVNMQLSIRGSVPVDSSSNSARQGMPDLDPTVEIGPSLEVKLYRSADSDIRVDLRLPARTVIATDLRHSHNVGWVFQPQINVDFRNTPLGEDWNLGFALGPLFGDKRYHNYYYGVAPEFATSQRPAYVAQSGYAGGQAIGSVSRRFQRTWFGAFVRWDSVSDAVFESSPLIRQQNSFAAGFAITWVLRESQQRVPDQR